MPVDSVDVTILDDEAPGVVITETDGGTSVVEPTEQVVMGIGQVIGNVTGNSFVGTFGAAIINENGNNDQLDNPQDIGLGKWSDVLDPEIGDTTEQHVRKIPHITIRGTGDDTRDYYSFDVTQTVSTNSAARSGPSSISITAPRQATTCYGGAPGTVQEDGPATRRYRPGREIYKPIPASTTMRPRHRRTRKHLLDR